MNDNEKYRILVAEDNPINIQVAKFTLSTVASVLDFATDGEEAVNSFSKNNYDVILMDMKMPVMDGIQATIKIRQIETQQKAGTRIPIIAMTANSASDEAKTCMEAGMDGFLSKPFKADDLKNTLKMINGEL